MARSLRNSRFRALVLALLLCVFAVRVIVPQGYMWSIDADGTPQMVLCSGSMSMADDVPATHAAHTSHAGQAAMSAQHHGDGRDHDRKSADHPCAFAAASAAVDLATATYPAALPALRAETPALLHISARPGLGLAAPPPPKTGPPLLA